MLVYFFVKVIIYFQELHRFLENKTPKIIKKVDNKIDDRRSNRGKLDFSQIPIEEQVVLLFPGQGTQHVGMGKKVAKFVTFSFSVNIKSQNVERSLNSIHLGDGLRQSN